MQLHTEVWLVLGRNLNMWVNNLKALNVVIEKGSRFSWRSDCIPYELKVTENGKSPQEIGSGEQRKEEIIVLRLLYFGTIHKVSLDTEKTKSTVPTTRCQETFMEKGPATTHHKFRMGVMDVQQLWITGSRICIPAKFHNMNNAAENTVVGFNLHPASHVIARSR